MARIHLMNMDKLKEESMIHENVRDEKLKNIAFRVQEISVQTKLGTALYKKILEEVQAWDYDEDNTFDDPYWTLYNDYIIPFFIAHVEQRSIPRIATKIKAKGVGKNNDEHQSAASKQEETNLEDDFGPDCAHYDERLVSYLRENYSDFEEYLDRTSGNIFPDEQEDGSTGSFMFVSGPKTRGCDKSERGYKTNGQ